MSRDKDCQLKGDGSGTCCCSCQHQIEDHWHCGDEGSDKIREKIGHKCVCSQVRGYVCYIPEQGYAHAKWPKHSCGCEWFFSTPLKKPKESLDGQPCPTCSKGTLHLTHRNYYAEFAKGGSMIVPGVWMEACDSCAETFFPSESSLYIEKEIERRNNGKDMAVARRYKTSSGSKLGVGKDSGGGNRSAGDRGSRRNKSRSRPGGKST